METRSGKCIGWFGRRRKPEAGTDAEGPVSLGTGMIDLGGSTATYAAGNGKLKFPGESPAPRSLAVGRKN